MKHEILFMLFVVTTIFFDEPDYITLQYDEHNDKKRRQYDA